MGMDSEENKIDEANVNQSSSIQKVPHQTN